VDLIPRRQGLSVTASQPLGNIYEYSGHIHLGNSWPYTILTMPKCTSTNFKPKDVNGIAGCADACVPVVRAVLRGEPVISSARRRVYDYLAEHNMLHLIESK